MFDTLRGMLISFSGPIVVVALFIGALFLLQNRLLYFPSTIELQDYVPPGMLVWPAYDEEQIQPKLSSDEQVFQSGSVLGLVALPPEEESVRGTVIVYHGNAGHAGHRDYYPHKLTPLGLRVILAEYPGYGPRPGQPNEEVLVNDAVSIARLAHERYEEPLWIIGESLGAGVAAAVSGRVPDLIRGVVLITPWNRLVDVAAHHYPFLPVRWLLRSDYDSIQALANFNGPKLVITAEKDTVVPAELGRDLHRNIQKPKRLIEIQNAGHNNWTAPTPPDFWKEAIQWLEDS